MIHSMQGWTATTTHAVTRKRSTKILNHMGNLLTQTSRDKAIENIGHKKAIYSYTLCEGRNCWHRYPCKAKNGDRKII